MCTHTCVCVCIHAGSHYTCMHACACMCVRVCTCVRVCVCVCTCVGSHVCAYVRIHAPVRVHIRVRAHACVHMCGHQYVRSCICSSSLYMCMLACVPARGVYVCVCVRAHVCVCSHACTSPRIYIRIPHVRSHMHARMRMCVHVCVCSSDKRLLVTF